MPEGSLYMDLTFIRYRFLEKASIWTRLLKLCLPKKWFQTYCFYRKSWKREKEVEGELQGIVVTMRLQEEWMKKFDVKEVIQCLEADIKEQKRENDSIAFLLEGELYSYYEQVESEIRCYPYRYHRQKQEDITENVGNSFLQKHSYVDWIKFFFLEELTEYYRALYGISKKRLMIEIIAGEFEDTKRAIFLLSNHLNYMVVRTVEKERYEPIAEQLYEETGLSILFMEQEEEEETGEIHIERLSLGEGQKRHTTIIVNLNALFPKAKRIRVTQHGIWIDQEILTSILMENVLNEDGIVQEEILQDYKKQYALYLRKVM